ncbi:MAG: PHP domain-containing protein [Ruminococcaceae bacterium]|nr:PHP domain-containing protein [Oscillospiraceae bacterium]
MKLIDLHTHSNCSDGSMTPSELVAHAAERGLTAIALSDHDTIAGIDEAMEAGKRFGVEVVPAIEFSVQSETETHILGFYIDHKSQLIKDALEQINSVRYQRTVNTCNKLRELGFDVTMEEALAIAPSGIIGRAHFARILAEKGYTQSVKEGFDKYLANGRPAYDGTQYLTAADAVKLINDLGGVSFVAHPHLIRLDDTKLRDFLLQLKGCGLCGIEGYYNEYTPEMQDYFQNLAVDLGLEICGGTDYHAKMKPHIEIGIGQGNMQIPYSVLENIKRIVAEKGNLK